MSFSALTFAKEHPYEVGGGVFVVGLVILIIWRRMHAPPALSEDAQIKLAQIQAQAAEVAAREGAAPGIAQARASAAEAQAQARADIQTAAIAGRTGIAEGRQGVAMNAANDQAAIREALLNTTMQEKANELAYQSAIYGDKTGYEIAQLNSKSAAQEYADQFALDAVSSGHYNIAYNALADSPGGYRPYG